MLCYDPTWDLIKEVVFDVALVPIFPAASLDYG